MLTNPFHQIASEYTYYLLFCLCFDVEIFELLVSERVSPNFGLNFGINVVAPSLQQTQSGFRKGRSCQDNTTVLQELIERRNLQGLPTYVTYIDLQKAYDSVWHYGLWWKLMKLGVKGNTLHLLASAYSQTNAHIRTKQGNSHNFQTTRGVR